MNRLIRYGTLIIGAALLGTGCEESTAPGESKVIPRPEYTAPRDPASFTTRVAGYAWDPEAFYMGVRTCDPDPKVCGLPPFLLDELPLYQRSAVRGARVSVFDPTGGSTVASVPSDDLGLWELPDVPSRESPPFFVSTETAGALPTEPIGPPLPAIPPGRYLPTVSLRPIITFNPMCLVQEATQISEIGILEAMEKYLDSTGVPTSVADFVNPGRFSSVTVVWLYQPGSPLFRVPAPGTVVEASAGQVYYLNWSTPGTGDPLLQSRRGFFVVPGATTSPIGLAVVLLRAGATAPPATVTYTVRDPAPADSVLFRPWNFPPVVSPPIPGVITYAGLQMFRRDNPNGAGLGVPNPVACLP